LRFGEVRQYSWLAIQDHPANIGAYSGLRDLGKSSAANRLKDDRGWPVLRRGLDGAQQLSALINGIIPGVKDFDLQTETGRDTLRRLGLFDLVIVIVGGQRNQNAKFSHINSTAAAKHACS